MLGFTSSRDGIANLTAKMDRIEQKLDLVLRHFGIEYVEEKSDFPAEARIQVQMGNAIGAIKAYREATGAGLADAKHAVEAYMANLH